MSPPGSRETGADAGRIEALVRAERARALYERNGIAQAAVVLNAAVVAVVCWGRVSSLRIAAWTAALWCVAAGRLALAAAYRRSGSAPADADRWMTRFTVGAGVNGVLWGAAPVILDGAEVSPAHLIFLAFVLAGMSAGAAMSNASHQPSFAAFTVPALLPMACLLLAGGDRLRAGMGIMVVVYAAGVASISRVGGRTLAEAARLRFLNADLAESVSRSAAELEDRVAERTAQLEVALQREREAERQLSHAARLATLGALAAGVAHEVNNPLAFLRSNLQYVREELARGERDPAAIDAMQEALADSAVGVERVGAIVRRLTDLSRLDGGTELVRLDLHAVLDACVGMSIGQVGPRATLVRDYGAVPEVLAERSGLIQVFLNLLLNAAQAIPEGSPRGHTIRIATRRDGEEEVAVEVTDTGCGIPAGMLDRIWDPFFSTRPVGEGTGLGLSICRKIVAGLGGRIAVRSREGAGSTFVVWLKAASAEQPLELGHQAAHGA